MASLIAMGEQRACDIFNVASGVNTFNQDIADALRPLGVDIRFSRSGEAMQPARCHIDNLRALGVAPADTLHTLQNPCPEPARMTACSPCAAWIRNTWRNLLPASWSTLCPMACRSICR